MMAALLRFTFLLAASVFTASAFEVNVHSRNGCREVLRCTGNGTNLEWKRLGSRSSLMSGGNKQISTTRTPIDMEGQYSFVSDLLFDPIAIADSGIWTCIIDSLTYSADLRIEAALASTVASHHNLSDRFIDDMLAVLCPVESCVPNVSVHLVRVSGDTIVKTQFVAPPNTPQFNLVVKESLVGRYTCRVVVNFMGMETSFEETFNITGTPMPRPTFSPNIIGGGGGGGGGNGGSAQSAMYSHTHIITLGLVILLMAVLLY